MLRCMTGRKSQARKNNMNRYGEGLDKAKKKVKGRVHCNMSLLDIVMDTMAGSLSKADMFSVCMEELLKDNIS